MSDTNGGPGDFKTCSTCGFVWHDREAFIEDPATPLAGYQVHFQALELGLFLFEHLACGTSLSVQAGLFRDLYDGPVFVERLTGGPACPGFCLREEMLGACPAQCECAYVREILDLINRRKPLHSS